MVEPKQLTVRGVRGKQEVLCFTRVCDGTFWERCPLPLKNKRNDVEEAG